MPFIFETTDPRGKRVVCTEETWIFHVLDEHPQMEDSEEDVKKTIEEPTYSMIYQDKDYPERHIYYQKQIGLGTYPYYIKAVVEFLSDEYGELVTSFVTDSPKDGEILIWKPRSRA